MMKLLKNNKGFTLIETLFVLSIFLLIVTISFIIFRPNQIIQTDTLFLSTFKTDMYYAQQYAITNKVAVNVNFITKEHRYYLKNQAGDIILTRSYAKDITVMDGSQSLYYRYSSTGNINTFGSIYMIGIKDNYKITFYIGKGRIYVSEI